MRMRSLEIKTICNQNHNRIRNGRRGLKSFHPRSNIMSAKTDEPTEIKSCSTSKLNILQQAFVLHEFEMREKEKMVS